MQEPLFKYRPLGRTGVLVSELCFGTMTCSVTGAGPWGMTAAKEDESFKMLSYFVGRGGNFIDTANVYGESETVVGKWLSTVARNDLIVATKVGSSFGAKKVNSSGLSRRHILEAVEQSLKSLQTNYIDLYQVHTPDIFGTPLDETFRTFDDLVRCGKVRYIGVSNYNGVQLQKIVDLTKHHGLERIVCLQPQYNLLCRTTEWDLIPICQEENIAVIPWSPLAGGLLSGKYQRDNKATEGSRADWSEKVGWKPTSLGGRNSDRIWNLLDVQSKIAKQNGMTAAQVAIRWLLQKPGVTAPIIGTRTLEQLKDNLDCLLKELTPAQMQELDDASAIDQPYPWKINS